MHVNRAVSRIWWLTISMLTVSQMCYSAVFNIFRRTCPVSGWSTHQMLVETIHIVLQTTWMPTNSRIALWSKSTGVSIPGEMIQWILNYAFNAKLPSIMIIYKIIKISKLGNVLAGWTIAVVTGVFLVRRFSLLRVVIVRRKVDRQMNTHSFSLSPTKKQADCALVLDSSKRLSRSRMPMWYGVLDSPQVLSVLRQVWFALKIISPIYHSLFTDLK